MTGGETFKCAQCHETFEKTRSDEEALADAAATWKDVPAEDDQATICEDCYQKLVARVRAEAPELLR